MKHYKLYADPRHGWLAVKRSELVELGILDKVSNYSYQSKSGATVYLEEDADMGAFFAAYILKHGITPAFTSVHSDKSSPIRSYPRFQK